MKSNVYSPKEEDEILQNEDEGLTGFQIGREECYKGRLSVSNNKNNELRDG